MSTSWETDDEGSVLDSAVEPPANVLLLAPAMTDSEDAVCCDLLTPVAPERADVLCLSLTRSPDDQLELWREHVGPGTPDNLGIVSVGETSRSAAGTGPSGAVPGPHRVETVSTPSDLTGLGIKLSGLLSEWEATGNQTAVCFHSITTLLQYADLERVFKFLHVATGRMGSVNALAHFHLDPAAHDEQTLNTLLSLFDTLVEYDDGTWNVRQR